jgi:hypothetical protein
VDYGTPEVEDSWIGRLWKWMSVTNLQVKLKGREEKVRCRDRVRCSCSVRTAVVAWTRYRWYYKGMVLHVDVPSLE